MMSPTNPPWSDLPQELLSYITKFLQSNQLDILRFRCVCKSWYSSSPSLTPHLLSPLIPLTASRPSFLHLPITRNFTSFSLSITVVYLLHPPNACNLHSSSSPIYWIAFIEQLNPGVVCIRRPFSKLGLVLPLDFPRKLNLLDFRVTELGRYYSVNTADVTEGKLEKTSTLYWDVDKVVVFSNGFGVGVLRRGGRLVLMRVRDNEWQMIHAYMGSLFDDIVDFRGTILGIDKEGKLYEIDEKTFNLNLIAYFNSGEGVRRKRLIESLGFMYLVVGFGCNDGARTNEMAQFKVYVLSGIVREWVEVSDISDRVFIFGLDFSMSASAKEFKGLLGSNCIIFDECSFPPYPIMGNGPMRMFNRSSPVCLSVEVYHLGGDTHPHSVQSWPYYPSILWPPPKWLWLDNKSKLRGTFEVLVDKLLVTCGEKFKPWYIEFSPLVGAVVSGDLISQHGVMNILNQADIFIRFLNELEFEIYKDSCSIKRDILEAAKSRQKMSKSVYLPIQEVGTSNYSWNRSEDTFQQSTQPSNTTEDEWLANEMSNRLGTHIELKMLLKGMVHVVNENDSIKPRGKGGIDWGSIYQGI